MAGDRAEAAKENKAVEEAFDANFDVIFNYGYGCCAFAHNICGSELVILDGMLDMSKRLHLEFFINHRCPSSAAPRVHTTDPDVDFREVDKSLLVTEVGLGTQLESLIRVTRESEEPDALAGTRDCILLPSI